MTEFWEIIVDTTGLFLCFITIIYVLAGRINIFSKRKKNIHVEKFNTEIYCQMMRQQFETSIAAIADVVNHEQQSLMRLADKREVVSTKPLEKKGSTAPKVINDTPSSYRLNGKSAYEEVSRLTNVGLNTGQISEKVGLPREEIELISKLKGKNFHS